MDIINQKGFQTIYWKSKKINSLKYVGLVYVELKKQLRAPKTGISRGISVVQFNFGYLGLNLRSNFPRKSDVIYQNKMIVSSQHGSQVFLTNSRHKSCWAKNSSKDTHNLSSVSTQGADTPKFALAHKVPRNKCIGILTSIGIFYYN